MQGILDKELPNGATVSDWLGTARTAANLAISNIDKVRLGRFPIEVLEDVETSLLQALNEVREVRRHIEVLEDVETSLLQALNEVREVRRHL